MPWAIAIFVSFIGAILIFESRAQTMIGDTSGNYPPSVVAFAKAIAKAEGFGVPGAIPTLANNPGDLVIPGWAGMKLGAGISVFSSVNEGWDRLYKQLNLILQGRSAEYSLNDTIESTARKWTETDPTTWALIVSSSLEVQSNRTLGDLLSA